MKAFIVNSKDSFDKKKNPHLKLSVKSVFENKKIKRQMVKSSHQQKKSQLLAEVIVALILLALGLSCLFQQAKKLKTHAFRKQEIVNSIFEEDMRNEIALTVAEINQLRETESIKNISVIYDRARDRQCRNR